jgi:probable rRNA maturation factor
MPPPARDRDAAMIRCEVIIEEPLWSQAGNAEALCQAACAAVAQETGLSGEAAILLSDNAGLHRLNQQFRGKDKPTDVLAFGADPALAPFLGDIALAYGLSAEDAGAAGKSLPDHLTHLVVHALLHLAGHDHDTEAGAAVMEALEIKVLASLGIANPYLSGVKTD